MDPDFEKLLAARDATASPPRRSRGSSGPSIRDLLGDAASLVGQAVVGLPSLAINTAQEFQRNPLGFTFIGDLLDSSDAYARGDIGEGALGTAMALIGVLGTPFQPTDIAKKVLRKWGDNMADVSKLPTPNDYPFLESNISGATSADLREFDMAILDGFMNSPKGSQERMVIDLLNARTTAELAARSQLGDEVADVAFLDEFIDANQMALAEEGLMDLEAIDYKSGVNREEVSNILDLMLSRLPWMKAVLDIDP